MNKKWSTIWLLLFLILSSDSITDAAKKRVCIIGAGVAGIAAVRQVSLYPEDFETVAFEKKSDVGGIWNYRADTGLDEDGMPILSNVYRFMRTNGPKNLMVYNDYVEFHGENRSYVTHMDMLRYIHNYTDKFNLREHIQFNTIVEKVSAISNIPDTQWNMRTRSLRTNEYTETICDAVMVCNGHYSKYHLPDIPGINTFPGKMYHSIFFREPQEFTGQTVVVLGASSSGTDIGLQISWYAKKVYLSHRQTLEDELPQNMEQVPAVVSVDDDTLTLSDGRVITANAFVLCTGYDYDFPFLGDDSGIEVVEGKWVRPLYQHFINVEHPTMAFVGLPFPSIPYPIAHVQSQYFVAMLQGKVKLPSREEMLRDSQLPPGVKISKAHYMGIEAIEYHDILARTANVSMLSDTLLARVYRGWIKDKKNDLMHFKDKDIFVREDGHVEMHRKYYPIFGVDQFEEDVIIY